MLPFNTTPTSLQSGINLASLVATAKLDTTREPNLLGVVSFKNIQLFRQKKTIIIVNSKIAFLIALATSSLYSK
jgi:hypothetical protein